MRIRERFNPRAPCGARQRAHQAERIGAGFQPTRPLRGATNNTALLESIDFISTHAPLAGRDKSTMAQ